LFVRQPDQIRYAVDNGAKVTEVLKSFHHTDNGCMML
jgi:hypothetical protein